MKIPCGKLFAFLGSRFLFVALVTYDVIALYKLQPWHALHEIQKHLSGLLKICN